MRDAFVGGVPAGNGPQPTGKFIILKFGGGPIPGGAFCKYGWTNHGQNPFCWTANCRERWGMGRRTASQGQLSGHCRLSLAKPGLITNPRLSLPLISGWTARRPGQTGDAPIHRKSF